MPRSKAELEAAATDLSLAILAVRSQLADESVPIQRRAAWLAGQLERLASEAYNLADEAGDDPCAAPIPGFDL